MRGIFFGTPFGQAAILYRFEADSGTEQVHRIFLPTSDSRELAVEMAPHSPLLTDQPPPLLADLVQRIQAYLAGGPADLPVELLDFSGCTAFQREVLRLVHSIPFGEVRSYQEIATELGKPNAARAVGSALARNPFPLMIPCHRCIRSDGGPGGFARPGLKEKLLELEARAP